MYLESCTPEQLKAIYAELDIDEESLKRNIVLLAEWTETQPHIPKITSEEWFQQFLLRGKNKLEKVKSLMDTYYKTRVEIPELFECRDPCTKEIKFIKDVIYSFPSPKLTSDGYRIIFGDIKAGPAIRQVDPNVLLQFYQMNSDLLLKTDIHRGVIIVHDMKNASFDYLKIGFVIMRRILKMHLKLSPTRYYKIYFVNVAPLARPMLQIFKRLSSKKISDRLEIWNKPATELNTVISKESLPKEYGGTLKSCAELNDDWYACLVEYREWFKNDTVSPDGGLI